MIKIAQSGMALGALGIMTTFISLFPGITGLPPTPGFGVIQVLGLLVGLSLLILGALIYARFMFYAGKDLTLGQQIGIRLSFTGLVFTALVSFADVLGFGSNLRIDDGEVLFGPLQIAGILLSFGMASLGVLIFAISGEPEISED